MTTRVRITPPDFAAYYEALLQMGRDIDAATARAVTAGAEVAQAGMQERAPKDTHNLEQHIQVAGPFQSGNFIFAEVGVLGADAETARYGNAQEYGWGNEPGQPYIRPTIDEDKGKVRRAMKESMEKELS